MVAVGAAAVSVITGMFRSRVAIELSGCSKRRQPVIPTIAQQITAKKKKIRNGIRRMSSNLQIGPHFSSAKDMKMEVMDRLTAVSANIGQYAVPALIDAGQFGDLRSRAHQFG